jgi:hypothetical protein
MGDAILSAPSGASGRGAGREERNEMNSSAPGRAAATGVTDGSVVTVGLAVTVAEVWIEMTIGTAGIATTIAMTGGAGAIVTATGIGTDCSPH